MPRPICTVGFASRIAACVLAACPAVVSAQQLVPKNPSDTIPLPLAPSGTGLIASMKHDVEPFGKTKDGQEVTRHTLTNVPGLRVKLINYGAHLIAVEMADRNGKAAEGHCIQAEPHLV